MKVTLSLNICGRNDEFPIRLFDGPDAEAELKAYVRANPSVKSSREDRSQSWYGQDYSAPLGYSAFKFVDGVPVKRVMLWEDAKDDSPEGWTNDGGETVTVVPDGPLFPGDLQVFYFDTDRSLFPDVAEFLDTAVVVASDLDDAWRVFDAGVAYGGPDPASVVYPTPDECDGVILLGKAADDHDRAGSTSGRRTRGSVSAADHDP